MSTSPSASSLNFPTDAPLTALDFAPELARWEKEFFGRDALFGIVDDAVTDGPAQVVVLTGEPGIGKSAFAARFVRQRAGVAAFHFCIDGRVDTVTPGTVLRSLAAQLAENLPGYAEALVETIKPHRISLHVDIRVERLEAGGRITGVFINRLATSNPTEDLEILLRAPLAAMSAPAQPVVIVIDGLDEAARHGGASNLVALLGNLSDLPLWVRLLYTTQSTEAVLRYLEFLHPKIVNADQSGDHGDIGQYVESRIARDPLRARLTAANIEPHALTAAIVSRAANNFLFCVVLLDDIEAGRQSLGDLDALPPSIDEIYRRYLLRFSNDDWYDLHKPVLGKLAVCRDNISEDQLARFAGIPASRVHRSLGIVDRFLSVVGHSQPKLIRLYHNSLRTFLLDREQAGYFWCDAAEENAAIAGAYKGPAGKPAVSWDAYGLRNLPSHLAAAGANDALRDLLLDYVWLRAKLAAATVQEVLADLNLAAPEESLRQVASVLRLGAGAISRDPDQLWLQLDSRAMNAPVPVTRRPAAQDGCWLRSLSPSLRQCDDPLVWSLTGHNRSVTSIIPLPGTSFIATASVDKTVRFWDPAKGVEVRAPLLHNDEVGCAAVSPNGKEFVTSAADEIIIWDLESGNAIDRFKDKHALDLAVSGDRPWIAATGVDVRIWNRKTRKSVRIADRSAWVCRFIPGTTLIAVRTDEAVLVIDVTTKKAVHQYDHGGFVQGTRALDVSADGRLVASAGFEKGSGHSFRILDLQTGICRVIREEEHKGPVEAIAFNPDASRLISGARAALGKPPMDHAVRVWDLKTERCIATFTGHSENVSAVAATLDGRYAISAAYDRRLLVWDLERPHSDKSAHQGEVAAAIALSDSKSILTAGEDGVINEWDVQSRSIRNTRSLEESIIALAATPNAETVLASCSEYSIIYDGSYFVDIVYVLREGKAESAKLVENSGTLRNGHYLTVCVTNDGRYAVLGRRDDEGIHSSPAAVELWDIKNKKLLHSAPYPHKFIRAIANLNEPGKVLIADTGLAIWDISDRASLPVSFATGDDTILAVALSPDHKLLAAAHTNGHIDVWDLPAKTLLNSFHAHDYDVTGVAFLGSSDRIVSSGVDGCLRIWEWQSGKLLSLFVGDDKLTALAVTPDARTILAGEGHGRVHFLQVEVNDAR